MGYDSNHVGIKTPKEGYDLIADEYGKYHTHLDSFDKGFFFRVLPRHLEGLSVLDLGAGDGRLWKFFKHIPLACYTACDISEKLLKRHPGAHKVQKLVCDLEHPLPFDDIVYDVALSFFVLEHICHLESLFQEIYRVLKPGGQWVIGHFLQRREFVWKKDKEQFKITLYTHRIQDLEKIAQDCFFHVDIFPIREKSVLIGHVLSLKKL